jgi:hypothetical protein
MTASAPSTKRAPGLRRWFHRGNLLTSIILVFPLWLVYQVGVLVAPQAGNGADFLSRRLLALLGQSRGTYLLVHLALALAFAVTVLVLRRRQQFDVRLFVPVVLESAIYALTMGSLILYVMGLLHINPALAVGDDPLANAGPATRLLASIGAGVNEELLFRLILLTGTVALLEKLFSLRRWVAVAGAFLLTAALFSAAHHVIGGEPWRAGVFMYRFFCGLFFAALFQWRGFAVAVYTHALYDVYVMVLR